MKLVRLAARMLRYRVAMMLALFFALGAAWHGGATELRWTYLLGLAALAASYICATCLNDVADREIDAINHAGHRGRPLVTGEATPDQLRLLAAATAVLAVAAAAPIGPAAVIVILASLAVNIGYSVPPLKLSHRWALAPAILSVAYVLLPFALGAVASGGGARAGELFFGGGLLLLFLSRILLKDFRDRAGDARYGKPTLLLRYGKSATCGVCGAALLGGDVLLCLGLRPELLEAALIQAFVAGIAVMGLRLCQATETEAEQIAIGLGARLGNGLLLMLLGWLVMEAAAAPTGSRLVFGVILLIAYGSSVLTGIRNPEQIKIGYRG